MTYPKRAVLGFIPLFVATLGCGGDDVSVDASPAGDGGGHDGGSCTRFDVAQICVRGTSEGEGEELVAGEPVRIQLRPEGCHSTSCTRVEEASCAAALQDASVEVEGSFCLEQLEDEDLCTPDCGGGGTAECATDEGLEAGDYTASHGDLAVRFSVPSTLPQGGVCEGEAET